MTSTLSIILFLAACGKNAIPTSPVGPTQNALVSVVRVQPSSAVIGPDGSVDLSALVRGARGQTVNGRPVTWRTSDDQVAFVDSNGRIVAGEEGTATITANVLGVEGQATVDVRGDVTEILIDSPLTNFVEGSGEQLSATLVYSNGATRPARGLRWSSADPSHLWVDGDGQATGRVSGDIEVRVRGRGRHGRRRIRVAPGNIASVAVFASATALTIGATANVWADVRNADGRRVSRAVAWSSSNPSVLSVDGGGLITALAAGTTTVTGTVSGVSGSLTLDVVAGGSGGSSTLANPSRVSDLDVSDTEERRLQLSFTEVTDGAGQPAYYEIRYGLTPGFSWNGAMPVSKGTCSSPIAGTQIGARRSCWVDGLVAAEDYTFQMVAARSNGVAADPVYGEISSLASGRTTDAGIVVDVTPSAFQVDIGTTQPMSASITDTYGNAVSGSATWTSTSSSVASVASNAGGGATVSGNAAGQATIRATFSGTSGSSSASITQPATPSSGGGSTPPPPSGQIFVGDFSSFTDDASLHAFAGTSTVNNVHADPGVGMRYDFQPFPNRCADQSLSSTVSLPSGTREVWMEFRVRFSSNWSERNANCASPAPGYKMVLTWLANKSAVSGHKRFDVRHRQDNQLHASVPGFSGSDAVPARGVVQVTDPVGVTDGSWHDVRVHQQLIGDDEALFQVEVDGVITHNYRTKTTTGLANNWLRSIKIGANRNLGATALMHVWWDDFQVWVGPSNPGFGFPAPQRY